MSAVDVVVVSYNSRDQLRACVAPLCELQQVNVVVVDNASPNEDLETVSDLALTAIQLERNGGFARGCNVGWRAGYGTYVLFLNPDARIDEESVNALARVLDESPEVGAVAPRINHGDGTVDFSQRRYPRLRSTYAQALFLHRLFPEAAWTDELVREHDVYERAGAPEWVSGAAIMVRRSVLEELGGWDQGFFMYCEDIDLCRRLRLAGYELLYEPSATVVHEGGASAPRTSLLPVLAASRIRYASKHTGRLYALLERVGIALGALTHIVVSRGGGATRTGHVRSLRVTLSLDGNGGPMS